MLRVFRHSFLWFAAFAVTVSSFVAQTASGADFAPHATVLKDYEKVVSSADGKSSLYTIWVNKKENQMYAELPSSYASQRYFIALTISSGDQLAGLQMGDRYVYWRRYNKRLALIEPNIETRSTGDSGSKASVKRLFTDRVLLDVPIITIGPSGGPVIDMDALLVGQASILFGGSVRPSGRFRTLYTIKKAKAFPENVELAFEVPMSPVASLFSYYGGGYDPSAKLQTLHYSISTIKGSGSYVPRKADQRVGYFTTAYTDLGKYKEDETRIRYINRWNLKKADSKLKLSPPAEPITFYIEHTTPIRYRRWVRQGILEWNKAFEKVGISDAINVEYQDPNRKNNSHMEKDPEDVRWNFVRWLNNDIAIGIGPSRVNPMTGQILDADIVLTDGWIRYYEREFNEMLPEVAMQGFSPEVLSWLTTHPEWDPRLRLASPAARDNIARQLKMRQSEPFGGHAMTRVDSSLIGDDPFDGLIGRTSQVNGLCLASKGKAFDVALMQAIMAIQSSTLEAMADSNKSDSEKTDGKPVKAPLPSDEPAKKEPKKNENILDGMPESFIGPLIAHLVAHEVGHTLGLRHNFKGSSLHSVAELNDEESKGKKMMASSVMDYIPLNINIKGGKKQGEYAMHGIGPYDEWAIEYGYGSTEQATNALKRATEPQLQFGTDEDLYGPDPYVRQFDLGSDPLVYAQDQIRLAEYHRKNLVEKFVKDGDSWAKARRGYELTLYLQLRSVSMMSNWIGGSHVNRDKKGDEGNRAPVQVVDVQKQRDALNFVIEHAFVDEAFGLTPELLSRMGVDKWLDGDGYLRALREDSDWPVHDRIAGIQAACLTMLMNPTTLRRVYDNEFRISSDKDALTLPELLSTISDSIWKEIHSDIGEKHTARKPMISSLRRVLQREHLKRLIDLSMPGAGNSAAYKPIANLALVDLREIGEKCSKILKADEGRLDPYTKAHLAQAESEIKRVLAAQYIYNANDIGGSGFPGFMFFKQPQKPAED